MALFRVLITSMLLSVLSLQPANARSLWVMIEARLIPQDCGHPLSCLNRSRVTVRNIMSLTEQANWNLTHTLNSMATLRHIPDSAVQSIAPAANPAVLHELPPAEKPSLLTNHPGVYFDSTRLDDGELTANFGEHIRSTLMAAGLKFLTEEERDATPGRPTLSVRFTERAESGGCVIPFAVSMSISEEAVLARNPNLKVTGTAWSGNQKENLANFNYTPMTALQELTEKLANDYRAANGKG